MNNSLKKKGFTVIELIAAIGVLIILSAIAFFSLNGYSKTARDTKRSGDLKKLELGLSVYSSKSSKLPLPSDSVDITSSGEVVMHQGYAGIDVLRKIGANKDFKDPSDEEYYTYIITKNHKNYEVMGLLEGKKYGFNNDSNSLYASDYKNRGPLVYGDKVGALLSFPSNEPIQKIGSNVDIATTNNLYTAMMDNDSGKIVGDHNKIIVIHPKYNCDRIEQLSSSPLKSGIYNTYLDDSAYCDYEKKNTTFSTGSLGIASTPTSTGSTVTPPPESPKSSCLEHLNAGETSDGIYTIRLNGTDHEVYCDMNTSGGGWTLIINRKQGGDNSACGKANLGEFINDGCGNDPTVSYDEDYSIGATLRNELTFTKYLFSKYKNGALDNDDSYILDYDSDLFSNSTTGSIIGDLLTDILGTILTIPSPQVCDINNSNCDNNNVVFKYTPDGYFVGSLCSSTYHPSYGGAYGLCHNGGSILNIYEMDSFYGDREGDRELKVWGDHTGLAKTFQDRIFVR